ncbi:MAG: glycosyltransferase [Ectothiorhodospiraceae bacterium]|nr:glycosyltransferase [Ectothiorhodospiraceae bacterium]
MRRLALDCLSSLVAVGLALAVWWPGAPPPAAWSTPVAGLALSPLGRADDPLDGALPSSAALAADLDLLAGHTRGVRTYSLEGALAALPSLAAERGLTVTAGVPLHREPRANAVELGRLRTAVDAGAVRRVVVGNEAVLRGALPVAQVADALDAARAVLGVPVSTAEPWHVWLRHRELAAHVDFLTVHLLPYWEGIAVDDAVDFVAARMAELRAAFPDKPLVIGEVGWPSRGRARGSAVASPESQARFLAAFVARAAAEGYDYYLLEAFDQPWKRRDEGAVGAHWGVFHADRSPKLAIGTGGRRLTDWLPALVMAALALLGYRALTRDGERLTGTGRVALATVATAAAWLSAAALETTAGQYWSMSAAVAALVVGLALAGALAVALTEAHEWVEARWAARAPWPPPSTVPDDVLPPVSVHLPVCNEPPELVAGTLRALAALDYPEFEVVVVDNNTRDRARWVPVRDLCARLGPRFRFVHVERLPGFKAGALNLALRRTAARADIVAVLDADYQVRPGWLRELVPAFGSPEVVCVQAPQDYRDGHLSALKSMCAAEYRGFFHLGMPVRAERNAIVQHGTMVLLRRDALEAAGGWAEWSITEDAELGVRLLAGGGRAVYAPASQGAGLTPDTFLDYKRQRLRWVLGAVHILRAHLRPGPASTARALTAGQRYHFLAGWLPWLADGASLVMAAAAIGWSALMLASPLHFDPPPAVLSLLPVGLLGARLAKHAHLYRTVVGARWRDVLGGGLAGLALMPTAGAAALMGIAGLRRPFRRTPKLAARHGLLRASASAQWEAVAALTLLAAAVATGADTIAPGPELTAWRVMLVAMSVPFLAAVVVALTSALPALRPRPYRALGPARSEAEER